MHTERTEGPPLHEDEFIEHFARLVEQDGGSRTAGRMAALLLLSPKELSLDEIAERVQASKASVSTNARLLEQWGVVEQVSRPGDRRDFYRARPDGAVMMLERRLEWMRRLRDAADLGSRTTAAQNPVVGERFRVLCRLHSFATRSVERTLRRLKRGAAAAR
ncbi:MAG TPA: MarR family transcriptional regulator [Longimicrobium sp.]|jgi:DNA-binding MarR family transcriptional regulator